jgi:cyclic 2,3-diphosphoglycerate synthase
LRYVAVIDGEHYPPVIESALEELRARGHSIAAAVLVGGKEKLAAGGLEVLGELPVASGGDPRDLLTAALGRHPVDAVMDLSDEPVLDYRRRHELAAVALFHGVAYEGADFQFSPPPRPVVATVASLAVAGTGKRTGKTAVAGFAARELKARGRVPVIVAMGRGGPKEPEVLRAEASLEPKDLLALADSGKHAASDYIEDALLGRVTTVGCRRCGGGLAGAVGISNVAEGVTLANDLDGDLLVLEGSGAALPPVHSDATVLVVSSQIPEEHLRGYMGPYRLLLADLVVVTMCEHPFASPSRVAQLTGWIGESYRIKRAGTRRKDELPVVRTVFRPTPTREVRGARVFVATTAPEAAQEAIRSYLEEEHGCEVVGVSHSLSDRERLEMELQAVEKKVDLLLCEIKAAGVDVATRWALANGLDVVYMDNVPLGVEGDDPGRALVQAAELATERFESR